MLSRYIERKLKTILKDKDWSSLKALLESHKRKPKTAFRRKGREAKRLSVQEVRAAIRAACVLRANGRCECGCGCGFGPGEGEEEFDHFLGRGRFESIETCWMLRREHHRAKTENHPSREVWDAKFAAHCWFHRYAIRSRLIKTPMTKVSEVRAEGPEDSKRSHT